MVVDAGELTKFVNKVLISWAKTATLAAEAGYYASCKWDCFVAVALQACTHANAVYNGSPGYTRLPSIDLASLILYFESKIG